MIGAFAARIYLFVVLVCFQDFKVESFRYSIAPSPIRARHSSLLYTAEGNDDGLQHTGSEKQSHESSSQSPEASSNGEVYVLHLSTDRFYVGKTRRNSHQRVKEHFRPANVGSRWTKDFPPLQRLLPLTRVQDDLESWERAETLERMFIYGVHRCLQLFVDDDEVALLQSMGVVFHPSVLLFLQTQLFYWSMLFSNHCCSLLPFVPACCYSKSHAEYGAGGTRGCTCRMMTSAISSASCASGRISAAYAESPTATSAASASARLPLG